MGRVFHSRGQIFRYPNESYSAFHRASLFAALEVRSGLVSGGLRTRPADILVTTWGIKKAPSQIPVFYLKREVWLPGQREENDAKCTELGWTLVSYPDSDSQQLAGGLHHATWKDLSVTQSLCRHKYGVSFCVVIY